ncbi:hypothetical protein [Pseudomonas sp. MWU12-2323]|uniref:hypothetical protein n=1 Tax=Pseudomonas sp. MWU12-2323 TaxID=2651296 RepID=UPI00128D9F69|nr:hypothetical protein [Pseudomonas sp. MWU12-2323]MPQ69386.1 hypothetical protein [Pseudomonas sp. MWU12-2323]
MQYDRLTNELVPPSLSSAISALAQANIGPLSQYPVPPEHPIYPVVEAEVMAKLHFELNYMATPPVIKLDGGRSEKGITCLVVAMHEANGAAELAGFILFKPRLPLCDSASISYAVVAEKYRRQGLLRGMIQNIKLDYPSIGLDCDSGLVPLWEALGFEVFGQDGGHIAMQSAPLSGKNWLVTGPMLRRHPLVAEAMQQVQAQRGSQAAFAEWINVQSKADQSAAQYIAKRTTAV